MSSTDNTSSNKTRNVRAKVIYASYEIAKQALLEGQSIRMPSVANADVTVLAAKAIGPIQFTPAEIAAVLQSTSIFPPAPSGTVPGPVTGLNVINSNAGFISLSWTTPSSDGGSPISSYTLRWTSNLAGNGLKIVSGYPPATTTLIDPNPNYGSFIFTIFATNSIGDSEPAYLSWDD